MAAVGEKKHGRHHDEKGQAHNFYEADMIRKQSARIRSDYTDAEKKGQRKTSLRCRRAENGNPIQGDKGITEGKPDGSGKNNDRQLAERMPVIFPRFGNMGASLRAYIRRYFFQYTGDAGIKKCGNKQIDDTEDDEAVNIKSVRTKSRYDRTGGEAPVTADRKGP